MACRFEQIDDGREQSKVDFSLHDCLMSAFAMMFFQDPSLLSFQRNMQDAMQRSNLQTIFQVQSIPKDTQMRDLIDPLPTGAINQIFDDFLLHLQRGKQLDPYPLMEGKYLIAIDGSEYFSSEKIHCPSCLKKQSAKGKMRYHHQILQGVMIHPEKRQVFPLAPEPIRNSDGIKKQDCEINAAKRFIGKLRKDHPKLNIIITADGLYSKQPFVKELKRARMSFILVAKPTDHKILFEWVNELYQLDAGESLSTVDSKGRQHVYRWVNDVPLNGSENAEQVNFFEYKIITDGKTTYRNSWTTDITVTGQNIITLVKGGRARWKIENETFNTLKNQGYHLEHNFGHGRNHLSLIFFLLNLLAFYMHQIFELSDLHYQRCRSKFTSRKEYWNQLRYTFRILIFRNWEHFLNFIYDPPMIMPP